MILLGSSWLNLYFLIFLDRLCRVDAPFPISLNLSLFLSIYSSILCVTVNVMIEHFTPKILIFKILLDLTIKYKLPEASSRTPMTSRNKSKTQNQFDLREWAKNAVQAVNSSAIQPQKFKVIGAQEDDLQEDTRTQTLAFSKLKNRIDDQETRKVPKFQSKMDIEESKLNMSGHQIQKKQTAQISNRKDNSPHQKTGKKNQKIGIEVVNLKKQLNFQSNEEALSAIPEIPYNKKVDEIMHKKPLRERLQGLMPPAIALPISFDHQQLLKRMEIIDRTISFLVNHRGAKIVFFDTIRKNIAESSNIYIQEGTLRQLLYLDENCYSLEWKINEKIRKYDLRIALPEDLVSMDSRKMEMRKKIIKHLLAEEAEFLINKKLIKTQTNSWHKSFQYKNVKIPMANLPVHPNLIGAELRAATPQQINKVQNPLLRSLMRSKRDNSDAKSLSKASVADMIFSKKSASEISEKLLGVIREKQKKNLLDLPQRKEHEQKIESEVCLKVCRQTLIVFMNKNVSNIFKVTLLEILCKRLKFQDSLIEKCINKIVEVSSKNQSKQDKIDRIGFLKEIESTKKLKVIQINRQKLKAIQQYFRAEMNENRSQ